MQFWKVLFVGLMLCLLALSTSAPAQVSFTPSYTPADFCPVCTMSVGDFNGDGKLDIVMAGSQVALLLGNGDGTFQPPKTISIAGWPDYPGDPRDFSKAGVTIGDFNLDAKLDIAAVMPESGGGFRVAVLLGNGNSTFKAPVTTFVDAWKPPMLTGDFNKDGKLDLAFADDSSVKVYSGNGDGTFQAPPYLLSIAASDQLGAADFNLDGKLDIFAGMFLTLGNGDGTFQVPLPVADPDTVSARNWGWQPSQSVIADFNRDGKPDLLVVRNGSRTDVTVAFGNGDGTFQPLSPDTGLQIARSGPILAAADFNIDGRREAVATHPVGGDFQIGVANTANTLESISSFRLAGDSPHQIVIGDFNGDNSPDLAVTDQNEERGNLGGGTYPFAHAIAVLLNDRGTRVSMTASTTTLLEHESLTVTASVAGTVRVADQPTGLVAFTDRGKVIGMVPLSGGQSILTLTNPGLGAHNITAYYLGDGRFNPNWSFATAHAQVRKKPRK